MGIIVQYELGNVDISDDVIATLAGVAVTECYGIVGMASKKIKDGFSELLKRENFSRGVIVRTNEEKMEIDLHVVVAFGTKISEVCQNVQAKVKFALEESLGISVETVNIFVQGVRVLNE